MFYALLKHILEANQSHNLKDSKMIVRIHTNQHRKIVESSIISNYNLIKLRPVYFSSSLFLVRLDANKPAGEEARRQLHKNVVSNIKQVLAATPHKAPSIQQPASHHENYPS